MPQHKKPTQEELDAATKKAVEEAERLAEKPEKTTPDPEPEPSKPDPEPEPEPEPSQPAPEPTPAPEPSPAVDYKEKFRYSSREAQKVVAVNRKINQAIDTEIPDPTNEEMVKFYPEWDVMDETSRKIAKDGVVTKTFMARIVQAREESKKIEKWVEDVDKFADDPQLLIDHPELEGKLDDFKVFSTQDIHNNVPLKLLVSAFLHETQSKPRPVKKGEMFPTGSGGPNDHPKPPDNKISFEDGQTLKNSDYKKYTQYLREGRIAEPTLAT